MRRVGRAGLWAAAASLADRSRPMPRLPTDKHSGQLVYRSARNSDRHSVWAAISTIVHPPQRSGDGPGNPLHREVIDAPARQAYLHTVKTAANP